MRRISVAQIFVFNILFFAILATTVFTVGFALGWIPLGDFRGVILTLAGVGFFYIYAIIAFRLFLWWSPLHPGTIPIRSAQESVYHVYLLFFLLVFYPVMRSGVLPVPLMRLFYLALGARLGRNTYSAGIIYDPMFVEIGDNTLIGQGALLIPHVVEGETLAHAPIKIGSNVTIGANAVILSNSVIEDHAVVAIGAVVKKGTYIKAGEIWAGVPAKKISDKPSV